MSVLYRLRAYHWVLAVLVIAAYLTGEAGLLHAWLGYGVAAIIVFRLIWALSGVPQLGLFRFYPQFQGLRLDNAFTHPAISRTLLAAIAISLIGATATGISMDDGKALGLAGSFIVTEAAADDEEEHGRYEHGEDEGEENEILEGIHELFANFLIFAVCIHVGYLVLFKRPLAQFMLFMQKPKRQ
jgi:cytochrome b